MKNNLESHIEKNKNILIYVNGKLMSRDEAKVSVYDSGFMMGDGVWEGIRLYNNKWLFLDDHIHRLYEGAKAIDLDINLTKDQLKNALFDTQKINKMIDRAHARVMITRGIKSKPFQRPSYSLDGPTIVIIMEYSEDNIKREPITLATVSQIRGNPMVQDPKLNSHSKLNCILACIQAEKAGADEALMLDPLGFVSTTNSCNFFIVKGSEVWTSTGDYCMNGITRKKIIEICNLNQISIYEKNFSLVDVYSADEAFITGTLGSLVSVKSIDGRLIENKNNYSMTEKLLKLYEELTQSD